MKLTAWMLGRNTCSEGGWGVSRVSGGSKGEPGVCGGSYHREAEVLPQAWEGGLPKSCTPYLPHQWTSPLAVWSLGHAVVLSSRLACDDRSHLVRREKEVRIGGGGEG